MPTGALAAGAAPGKPGGGPDSAGTPAGGGTVTGAG